MKHFFSRLLAVLFWFAPVSLALGLWYLNRHGLDPEWRERVAAEFARKGISLSFDRLTLNPFRGLVAGEVDILHRADPSSPSAHISRMILDIDYANLNRRQPFLDGILLRNATIAIPGAAGAPGLRIEGLDARVTFEPALIRLRSAVFHLRGIRCELSGTVRNAPNFGARGGAAPRGIPPEVLARIGSELAQLAFDAGSARFRAEFDIDMADPGSLRVQKASLTTGRVQRDRVSIDRLQAEATFRDGLLELHQFTASDATGALEGSGSWNARSRAAEFQVRSTLAIQEIIRTLVPAKTLSGIQLYDAPEFQASLRVDPQREPHLLATGHLAMRRFGVQSVVFDGFRTLFAYDGRRLLLEDAQLLHRSGALNARLLSEPGDIRVQLGSTMNPQALGPLLGPKAMEELARWKFDQPPRLTLDARGPSARPETIVATGKFALGSGTYRGIPFLSGQSDLRMKENAFHYENFQVRRTEGTASGNFVYDVGKGEARLHDIRSTLHPTDFAGWISPPLVKDLAPYRFTTRPSLRLDGIVKLRTSKGTRLNVAVEAPDGMTYTFLGKDLVLSRAAAQLRFEDATLTIQSLRGDLLDGAITARAVISLNRAAPGHEAEITVKNIDFTRFTRLYFGYTDSKGRMSGTYRFTGGGGDARTMVGEATVGVVAGDVFAIPFLGPLSGLLNAIVPGLGYSIARNATATATVRDGVIRTSDFKVDAPGFTMIGGGDLFFLDDRMDFTVRVNAKGLPGVLLFPVSKLFEFTSDESLSKPQWRPRNLPLPR